MTVAKVIASSPPGKAKFYITMSAPASFPGAWVNTDKGRSAPRITTSASVLFPISAEYAGWGVAEDRSAGIYGARCAWFTSLPPKSLLPGIVGLFKCYKMFSIGFDQSVGFGTSPGNYSLGPSYGEDLPESSVDALIAALSGVKPVIEITAYGDGGSFTGTAPETTTYWYFPDGRRVDAIG